jgi:hypothetical protein
MVDPSWGRVEIDGAVPRWALEGLGDIQYSLVS